MVNRIPCAILLGLTLIPLMTGSSSAEQRWNAEFRGGAAFATHLPLSYSLRVGGTFNHIEIENEDGELVADSDHGIGWEIGAGLVYDLNDRWQISPGIRYRALSREIGEEDAKVSVDLGYVAAEVGIAISF
jgi:opacity protein-like surface antigen